MHKITLLFSFICFLLISNNSDACGGITHMLIAKESVAFMSDAALRNIILDNMDAYLVGSNYPDSGYVDGAHYGEDSHWEPFISAFINYLHTQYVYPDQQNPKLVAFMLGCATHVQSDIIFHGLFLGKLTEEDFHGDRKAAHTAMDNGLDLLINIERNQWITHPLEWWVPVNDLVAIYHDMGKDQYTAKEILWGNDVYSKVGIAERVISPDTYAYIRWRMPWMSANYYSSPNGGVVVTELTVANYTENVWHRLVNTKN